MSTAPQAAEALTGCRLEVAQALVEREFARHPELERRYGARAREKSLQDAGYHVAHLIQALAVGHPPLFTDYVAWARIVLARRKVRSEDLAFHLGCLAEVLREKLPAAVAETAAGYVESAVNAMPGMPDDLPTFLEEGAPLSPLAHQYLEALRRGERHVASRLVLDAVAQGTPVRDLYLHVFQPVQYEIGRLWQTNRFSVAQEHYCTAATQLIMSQLYPMIFGAEKRDLTLVATGVSGDLHELGVRMVADFFEMEGWNTFYLGANTPHGDVLATLRERRADILAVSATLPYHAENIRELINVVRREPEFARLRILVGGHPFNRDPELWRKLGADGTAVNAQQAIALAEKLVQEARG
jgi:MerR family transcriptional regulator, light-induced transcriptional regulator